MAERLPTLHPDLEKQGVHVGTKYDLVREAITESIREHGMITSKPSLTM